MELDEHSLALASPLLLVGRGGSGTRLLPQLALPAGVFLGSRLNRSLDACEWTDLIYRLVIDRCEGRPSDAEKDRRAIVETAAAMLSEASVAPDRPWGWKLPETTLVLAKVLEAFPRARVVHLMRHPITSALRRSHLTSRLDNPVGRAVLAAAYKKLGRDWAAVGTDEVYVHNAVTWLFHMNCVADLFDALPSDRRLLFRYEEIGADVAAAQGRLFEFLGAAAQPLEPPAVNSQPVLQIDPGDAAPRFVWDLCGPMAVRFGYAFTDPWQPRGFQ